jgi:hypothetical protein
LDVNGTISTKGLRVADNSNNSLLIQTQVENNTYQLNLNTNPTKEYYYYENDAYIPTQLGGATAYKYGASICSDGANYIYYGLGGEDWTINNTFFRFNPNNKGITGGGWERLTSDTVSRNCSTAVFANDRVYTIGGNTSGVVHSWTTTNAIRVFNPNSGASGAWAGATGTNGSAFTLPVSIAAVSAVYDASNSFIYWGSGMLSTGSYSDAIYRIQVNSNGSLSNHTRIVQLNMLNSSLITASVLSPERISSLVILNGRLYVNSGIFNMVSFDLNELAGMVTEKKLMEFSTVVIHNPPPGDSRYWRTYDHNGSIYISNGTVNNVNAVTDKIYRYNSSLDKWQFIGRQEKHLYSGWTINHLDKIYIFGGWPGSGGPNGNGDSSSTRLISKFYVNTVGEGKEIRLEEDGIKANSVRTGDLYLTGSDTNSANYKLYTDIQGNFNIENESKLSYYTNTMFPSFPNNVRRQMNVVTDGTNIFTLHHNSADGTIQSNYYKFKAPEATSVANWNTLNIDPSGSKGGVGGAYYNGKIYCFGGFTNSSGTYATSVASSATNHTRIYDLSSNTWSAGASIPTLTPQVYTTGTYSSTPIAPINYIFPKCVVDTSTPSTPYIWVLIIGTVNQAIANGSSGSGNSARIYRYNINANNGAGSWEFIFHNFYNPYKDGSTLGVDNDWANWFTLCNGYLYTVGVNAGANQVYSLKLPYISGSDWVRRANCVSPTNIWRSNVVTLNNKIYQIGFWNNTASGSLTVNNINQAVYEYNEESDTWTYLFDQGHLYATATYIAVGSSIFAIGGVGPGASVTNYANITRTDIRRDEIDEPLVKINQYGDFVTDITTPNLYANSLNGYESLYIYRYFPMEPDNSGKFVSMYKVSVDAGGTPLSFRDPTSNATKNILAANVAVSDLRIKKNILTIDDNVALNKLRLIEPKTYNYIENYKTDRQVIGFLAQNVKEYLPEAILENIQFIPNIYENKDINQIDDKLIEILDIQNYDISLNDIIQILTGTEPLQFRIEEFRDNKTICSLYHENPNQKVSLNSKSLPNNVLVYGKQVNDFLMMHKEYLFTINFAATQELDRIIDWHTKEVDRSVSGNATSVYGQSLLTLIKALQEENTSLKTRVSTLETQLQNVLTRLSNANL